MKNKTQSFDDYGMVKGN